MQLPEASFVPFRRWALGALSLANLPWIAGDGKNKAFSCKMYLVHEGDHIWSGFQSMETTRNPSVHREQEAAQTLLGPRQIIRLGEKKLAVLP